MGRFYKTAKPTFVDDVIYQAPYELMLNALKTQDAEYDKQQENLDAFSTMGDLLDFVDKDRGARNERLDYHRGKSNDLAEKIQQNPALYQSYVGEINRAKKEFEQDIKSGSLFEMDRTAKRRTQARADLKTRFEKGQRSEDAFIAAQETMDREYQGVGNGDYAESIHVYDKVDENAYQEHLKKIITPNSEGATTTKPDGAGYMLTNGEVKTYISKDKVENAVVSDPKFKDWEREQLQTLERQYQGGAFESEEAMRAEFSRRRQSFIDNSLAKLPYEQINTTDTMSTDSAYWQKQNLGLNWARFNYQKKKDEQDLEGYKVEMNGTFEDLDDDKINALYGSEKVRVEGPADEVTGEYPTAEISTAEKRKRLEAEKKTLNDSLTKRGLTMEDFRNKMMSHEGRIELAESLGMSKEKLARQANYDKTYSFTSVKSPLENGQDVIENVKYLRTVTNTFNNMAPNEMVTVKIVDSKGRVTREKSLTLGEAYEKGYVQGQTSAKSSSELIPKDDGYLGLDGEKVFMPNPKYDPDKEGSKKLITATKEYVIAKGNGKKQTTKEEVFDATKPLLHIKPDQISQSKKRDYGNGKTKATEKQMHNIHTSKMIDGELKTIIISKELKIDPLK